MEAYQPTIAPSPARAPRPTPTREEFAAMRQAAHEGNHQRVDNALIIGGGPGGLSAAVKLAEKGIKVTVLEVRDQDYRRPHQLNARQSTLDAMVDLGVYDQVHNASGWTVDPTGQDPFQPHVPVAHLAHGNSMQTIFEPSVAQVRISDVEKALYDRAMELGVDFRAHTQAHITGTDENGMASVALETVHEENGRFVADGPAVDFGKPDLVVVCDGANSPTRKELEIPFREVSEPRYYLGGEVNKAIGPEYRKMRLIQNDSILHLMATGHARYPQTWISVEVDQAAVEMTPEKRSELLCRRAGQIMGEQVKPEDLVWGAGQITVVQNRRAQQATAGNNVVLFGDAARTGSVWVSGGLNLAMTSDLHALGKLVDGINTNDFAREWALNTYDCRVQGATTQWHRAGENELPPQEMFIAR